MARLSFLDNYPLIQIFFIFPINYKHRRTTTAAERENIFYEQNRKQKKIILQILETAAPIEG